MAITDSIDKYFDNKVQAIKDEIKKEVTEEVLKTIISVFQDALARIENP